MHTYTHARTNTHKHTKGYIYLNEEILNKFNGQKNLSWGANRLRAIQ